ncbi:MAG: 50S ribosomal protein L25 [Vulcanimicrobiaceae bacterium]
MTTTSDTLAAELRANVGTTSSNALRREGKIPGVLFGHGAAPTAIALNARTVSEMLHAGGRNRLLTISLEGKNDTALVRDVQRDPISRRILHVDFQRVSATEEISATLPVVTLGVAKGVAEFGGVLEVVSHTIGVRGPANALPDQIEIDVSELGVHEHISAGDLKLPAGIQLDVEPATVLVSVAPSTVARQLEEESAAAEPSASAEVPLVAESTEGAEAGS